MKDQTFKGSSLVMPEQMLESETVSQTIGEVIELGSTAYNRGELSKPWCKVGDKVHFQRYGAVRLAAKEEHPDTEFWVINDVDVLVVDTIDEVANVG